MTTSPSILFNINNKNCAPYNAQFDDIYFDVNTGSAQNKTTFIEGNNIAKHLLSNKETLTIAETGFGCGLNFLLTLQAFHKAETQLLNQSKHSATSPQVINSTNLANLTFISVEKYPLSLDELKKTLSLLPELASYAQLLIEKYPSGAPSKFPQQCQLNFFDSRVTLTLIFDDACKALSAINTSKLGLVNAWYLDGFSPAKNPEMWSLELFEQIGRISKDQATLTALTMSEKVRKQLMEVGFRTQKIITSECKTESLMAKFQQNKASGKGYQLRPEISKPEQVAIIGGGIASACAAYALTKQGVNVTLYCKESRIAQGASNNAIGAIYPLLHQQKDDISEFYQQAFWHAKALYQDLLNQGANFSHSWCGLLDVSYKDSLIKRQHSFEKINAWPHDLIHSVNAEQANQLSSISLNLGGLFMPHAGWVSPPELVEQLFIAAKKTNRVKVITSTEVKHIEKQTNGSWTLQTNNGDFNEKILIVCGGADTIKLNIVDQLPLSSVRGQVTSMKSNSKIKKLSTILCHKGYLTPADKGSHCIGATFSKDDFDTTTRPEDDIFNLEMLQKCLPKITQWHTDDINKSKARLRCTTPDHLPMVGAMPDIKAHQTSYSHLAKDKNWKYNQPAPVIDNLYVMTGFGARGLCSAPLLADILTADICGTVYPVNSKTLFNISANRFVIRDIIKRK